MMKRSIALMILLVSFVFIIVFGIVWALKTDEDKPLTAIPEQVEKTIVRYPVSSGKITHTETLQGKIYPRESTEWMKDVTVDLSVSYDFILRCRIGDNLNKGDILCSLGTKEYVCPFNARIADVNSSATDVAFSLMNYDALCIKTEISQYLIDKITMDTPVSVRFNGKSFPSEILGIDYQVIGGAVGITVKSPSFLLPGSDVSVVITTETIDRGLFVSAKAVVADGSRYYGYVETPEGYQLKEICIGESFVVEENGVEYPYYEVLSGVDENDFLIVEQIVQ